MKHLLITTIAAVLLVGTAFADPIHDGTDVVAKGGWKEGTPLHYAAWEGHKEIAELLIVEGADVNVKDKNSATPLHLAAEYDHKEIAELLIANGADVNAKRSDGSTPLDWAKVYEWNSPKVKAAKKEIANFLRTHGGKTGEELKAEGK
jgi:hypothetical protein